MFLTGVYGLEAIADQVLYKGAYAQQHRGEDGVGVYDQWDNNLCQG